MKANCWMGKKDVQVMDVPDPQILNKRDAMTTGGRGPNSGSRSKVEREDDERATRHTEAGRRGASEEDDKVIRMKWKRNNSCMDAVGLEPHAPGPVHYYDRMKQAVMLESDRPYALRQAILACRNGGTVSVPGVYGGFDDKFPIGAMMNKGLTIRTSQTHVPRCFGPLLERIKQGEIDPNFIITHRMRLEDAPKGFDIFTNKEDGCIKIVLKP